VCFLERQYCQAVGIVHGQKSHDFLRRLIAQGYVTPITPGSVRRGRMYHVQYTPFYEAIGERDNRHRKPTTVGRLIRRLMLLDAVLSDHRYHWLGTERDKFRYFDQVMKRDIPRDWYPHIVFQHEDNEMVRLSTRSSARWTPGRSTASPSSSRRVGRPVATSRGPRIPTWSRSTGGLVRSGSGRSIERGSGWGTSRRFRSPTGT
jgi:hypothetical protein